jgi:hypothetical protein
VVNVAKYLSHWGQYASPDVPGFTDTTSLTSVTTVACFAYYGEAERSVGGFTGRQFQQSVGWFVILPNSYHTVQVGDRLDQIVDKKGTVVREGIGRVEERVVYRHHRRGVQFVQVRLNDN